MRESKEHIVDFRVFKKSKEEKAKAQTAKKNWERNMKLFYGDAWKKEKRNNYPFTLANV